MRSIVVDSYDDAAKTDKSRIFVQGRVARIRSWRNLRSTPVDVFSLCHLDRARLLACKISSEDGPHSLLLSAVKCVYENTVNLATK